MRDEVRFASASSKPAGGVGPALFDDFGGRRRCGEAIGDDPAAVFLDPDRNRLVALFVEILENRGGRRDRDFVFSRSPAIDDANAKFLQGSY